MKTSRTQIPTVAVATRVEHEIALALRAAAAEHDTSLADFVRETLTNHPDVQAHLTPARPKRRTVRTR